MSTQTHDTVSPSSPSRSAALQSRPPVQRAFIRSWEYIKPVRVTVLAIRLLVVMWLVVLGAILLSLNDSVGWALFPGAAAVLAFSVWVFSTAAKGCPAVDA